MGGNNVLLSGTLLADPVAVETGEGLVATFSMTGGKVPWDAGHTAPPDMRADQGSIDRAGRMLEVVRASGHVYKVTVSDVAGEFTLFYLRKGQSVSVLGEIDMATGVVTNVRLINSTMFLAFLDDDRWRAVPVKDHDAPIQ